MILVLSDEERRKKKNKQNKIWRDTHKEQVKESKAREYQKHKERYKKYRAKYWKKIENLYCNKTESIMLDLRTKHVPISKNTN